MLATDGFLSQRDANKPEEEKTKKKKYIKKANKSMLIRGIYYILYK